MEIIVDGYWQNNLGDDLFLKIICEKYPQLMFETFITKKNSHSFSEKNLDFFYIKKNLLSRIMNKLFRELGIPNLKIRKASAADAFIQLGGSIFMLSKNGKETAGEFVRRKILIHNPNFFIIGSNFGPYYSDKQFDFYHKFFSRIFGACFRDTHSYNFFSDLPNVAVAPDVVLGMNIQKYKNEKKKEKRVIFSIVDCDFKFNFPSNKSSFDLKNVYNHKIANLADKFVKDGYEVVLFSFCEAEGDLRAAKEIMKIIIDSHPEITERVKVYNHKSTENSLRLISTASKIIATRFHAMILGWIFQIPTFVISYSRKTTDVIKDVWPEQNYVDIEHVDDVTYQTVEDLNFLPSPILTDVKSRSKFQFQYFDKFLENMVKNE
ncbi:polysaccharide pyruvyl transferase family protein [Oenococcus oeni]|uniref:polysaccharide pyruvyl transferase family protein n=1 Tax=Oenococcus oeni TaxID=1247 RepID=UPI0010AFB82E|nr:polysaccharide pyruvyl transferase family protein [Oenococcus oeni]SYW15660.1 putative Polysaccharide pyruvyl transferase family protein [Oenococcus oeni]